MRPRSLLLALALNASLVGLANAQEFRAEQMGVSNQVRLAWTEVGKSTISRRLKAAGGDWTPILSIQDPNRRVALDLPASPDTYSYRLQVEGGQAVTADVQVRPSSGRLAYETDFDSNILNLRVWKDAADLATVEADVLKLGPDREIAVDVPGADRRGTPPIRRYPNGLQVIARVRVESFQVVGSGGGLAFQVADGPRVGVALINVGGARTVRLFTRGKGATINGRQDANDPPLALPGKTSSPWCWLRLRIDAATGKALAWAWEDGTRPPKDDATSAVYEIDFPNPKQAVVGEPIVFAVASATEFGEFVVEELAAPPPNVTDAASIYGGELLAAAGATASGFGQCALDGLAPPGSRVADLLARADVEWQNYSKDLQFLDGNDLKFASASSDSPSLILKNIAAGTPAARDGGTRKSSDDRAGDVGSAWRDGPGSTRPRNGPSAPPDGRPGYGAAFEQNPIVTRILDDSYEMPSLDGFQHAFTFDGPARFPRLAFAAPASGEWGTCPIEEDGVVIHESMSLLYNDDGTYELRFTATSVATPVRLALQLAAKVNFDNPNEAPILLTLPPFELTPTDFNQASYSWQVRFRGSSRALAAKMKLPPYNRKRPTGTAETYDPASDANSASQSRTEREAEPFTGHSHKPIDEPVLTFSRIGKARFGTIPPPIRR